MPQCNLNTAGRQSLNNITSYNISNNMSLLLILVTSHSSHIQVRQKLSNL